MPVPSPSKELFAPIARQIRNSSLVRERLLAKLSYHFQLIQMSWKYEVASCTRWCSVMEGIISDPTSAFVGISSHAVFNHHFLVRHFECSYLRRNEGSGLSVVHIDGDGAPYTGHIAVRQRPMRVPFFKN